MNLKVSETCHPDCGVRVKGELDSETREFIYRFALPSGLDSVLKTRETEVEGVRLLTFSPDAAEWYVECPVCRRLIGISRPGA